MSTQQAEETEKKPEEIRSSRALSAKPCARCCAAADEAWRTALNEYADFLEFWALDESGGSDLPPIDKQGQVFWMIDSVFGIDLRSSRPSRAFVAAPGQVILEPVATPISTPETVIPIKPWGKGWVKMRVNGLRGNLRQYALTGSLTALTRIIGNMIREIASMKAENQEDDSCKDCVRRSTWGQQNKQKKEETVIRRRVKL